MNVIKNLQRTNGFTLIEILIATIILCMILLAASFVLRSSIKVQNYHSSFVTNFQQSKMILNPVLQIIKFDVNRMIEPAVENESTQFRYSIRVTPTPTATPSVTPKTTPTPPPSPSPIYNSYTIKIDNNKLIQTTATSTKTLSKATITDIKFKQTNGYDIIVTATVSDLKTNKTFQVTSEERMLNLEPSPTATPGK